MVEYRDRLSAAMARAGGVTAHALADELKVTYQTVKKVLDGKSSAFNAANNSKAAKFLGVSSDWLALGIGTMERGGKDVLLSWPFGDYSRYESLAPEKKEELRRIVDAFLAGAEPVKSATSSGKAA